MADVSFAKHIQKVLNNEGGYVDHPDDRGGPTNFGITQETARQNGYYGDMRHLTREQAIAIYRKRYWLAPGFDKLDDIHNGIAALLLDIGVNAGPVVGVRFLQRSLNVLNRQGKDFPDMTVDGVAGPQTRACLQQYLAIRGREGANVLIGMIRGQLSNFYIGLAESNPSQENFVFGWVLHRALGDA